MHGHTAEIDIEEVMQAGPIQPGRMLASLSWAFLMLGIVMFCVAFFAYPRELMWGAFYVNLLFWMGLAVGGCMCAVIFQIVRAHWSPPIRRLAEANIAFLPWAYILVLSTYFAKEYLFPWARGPMPGREWWMEPDFVYARFSVLLLILFYGLYRFVKLSIRSDIGFAKEVSKSKETWSGHTYDSFSTNWKGYEKEVPAIQVRMSTLAPVLVILYAIIWSLFAFEMVMGMDTIWYSNMFAGWEFVGNIYMGWAVIALTAMYLATHSPAYGKVLQTRQLHDLGQLCLGFGILWAYMFFAQFLPQWYGNLPEETQWMMLRTREEPWKLLGWVTFACCWLIPFVIFFSEDVKKAPRYFAATCFILLTGLWLEKYMIVMPQLSPDMIPFGVVEISLFLGFLGLYVLSIQAFLKRFPYVPVSHPLTHGSDRW